eukprot:COSAG01_NODE_383_length_17798_cov_351.422058_18_plen_73_part_00
MAGISTTWLPPEYVPLTWYPQQVSLQPVGGVNAGPWVQGSPPVPRHVGMGLRLHWLPEGVVPSVTRRASIST